MNYFCCTDRRRSALSAHPTFNGIDFLEVQNDPGMPDDQRQRALFVHFVNPLSAPLSVSNVLIVGGESIQGITVTAVKTTQQANVLEVDVDRHGDFSTYTLRLVQGAGSSSPPVGYDALLSSVDFSFKVECSNDFDCQVQQACPPDIPVVTAANYLAKDYASFLQVMLDRMALLAPQWAERNPADAGMVLVELLAYVGDYLSYEQDAIATEAYIGTARRRISVRRHARLLSYPMHDGSNARAWVQVKVSVDTQLAVGTQLLTQFAGKAGAVSLSPGSTAYAQALVLGPQVFEFMDPVPAPLFAAHNTIYFYTWGDQECCLPAGATGATLCGKLPSLKKGDILIFQEQCGPITGEAGDADPSHRHAVRLTAALANTDPLGGFFLDQPTDASVDVTDITWDAADALPFALCISARTDEAHGNAFITCVSVALGNVVLADQGLTKQAVPLGQPVPTPTLALVTPGAGVPCSPVAPVFIQPRYRPCLPEGPLTQVGPFDPTAPATTVSQPVDMAQVMPSLSLTDSKGNLWNVQRDLLASDPFARDFVAEVGEDGLAILRFGDDVYGLRPEPGLTFSATYRLGNGTQGNIGAGTLAHIVSADPAITAVNNPLAAWGGVDPESIEDVRLRAPVAFRQQERAVTPDDYAQIAQRYPGVLRAAATYRWTGSWNTVFLTIDRQGGLQVDETFKQGIGQFLEPYRMAGQDVEIDGPLYVSLEIAMRVCVLPGYLWSDVQTALLAVFSNRILPGGQPGLFYPGNFTFGQIIYLSPLYAAAQGVAGVNFVEVITFQRYGIPSTTALDQGMLVLDRLEIARLDNDLSVPDHGVVRLSMFM